jgi:hypothetical protein
MSSLSRDNLLRELPAPQCHPSRWTGWSVSLPGLVLRSRAASIASKPIVVLDLLGGENRTGLEMCPQVNGTELTLERGDASHSRTKEGLADRALAELALESGLFHEDQVAQTLGLACHVIEQPLHRPTLVGTQV